MHRLSSWSLVLAALAITAAAEGCSDDGAETKAATTGQTATGTTTGNGSSAGGGGSGGGTGGDATTTTTTGTGGAGGGPCVDDVNLPLDNTPPAMLSQTGLYVGGVLAPYVQHFTPQYILWSDGAVKERWVYLPKCSQIDTTDMDHWKMPVGARFWKEFTRDGVRVETRMIHRYGPEANDFIFAAYQWDANQMDAVHVPNGVVDASGTPHDIPAEGACINCHAKLDERILGFGAIQLSYATAAGDPSILTLSDEGRLTTPVAAPFVTPGDPTAQAAIGYLHANCGNCHNDTGIIFIDMRLRLLTAATAVDETSVWQTAVGKPATNFQCNGCSRIEPGDAAASAIIQRMSVRGTPAQMPPIGTEVVDDTGVQKVTDWIDSLAACSSVNEVCNGTISCCNGSCVNQICVDACTTVGAACSGPSDCCTGTCTASVCACSGDFAPCASDADCCGNVTCDLANGVCL